MLCRTFFEVERRFFSGFTRVRTGVISPRLPVTVSTLKRDETASPSNRFLPELLSRY